jgi:predicted nicotinamide N-methyase
VLEWGVDKFPLADTLLQKGAFDVVLMSDVLYTDYAIPLLVQTIDLCISPIGMV